MATRTGQPRLGLSTVAYVLTLCVPYIAAATPLPEAPSSTSTTSTSTSLLPRLAISALERFSHFDLYPRHPPAIDPSRIKHPVFGLAIFDTVTGLYKVPIDYVRLHQEFNGGFIVLSYIIAFVGSVCTLELLIRRTTNTGWKNQLLLLSAGLTFGAVSTFSMHFIFNNSLSLHHPLQDRKGYPALHLSYNPGYTVLSLVASCTAMTLAFFIMGTDWHDWWCLPGARGHGRRKKSYSEEGGHNDEYGKWKSTQKKVIRRGTMGVGALLQHAGGIAKWSLMHTEDEDEQHSGVWKSSMKKGKGDEVEGKDKKLEELDFRLGKSAVQLELDKRNEVNMPSLDTPQPARSLRQMPSNNSLVQTPLPVFYPPSSRRGSIPDQPHSATSEVFTPGFSFPRIDHEASSSTTRLLPDLSSPYSSIRSQNTDQSPIPLPDLSKRRASLPIAVHRPEPTQSALRQGFGLTRIQSLPEADQDGPSSRSNSYDKNLQTLAMDPSPTNSAVARIQSISHDEAGSAETLPKKRVTIMAKPKLSVVEKFLGFDVVTRGEIVKIFITGTIAGFGVAAMHYIGQLSITGIPYIAYKAPYVVGSIVIASGAVVIALYIMFIMLRPKLKHTWLSKLAVALILAVAVCAMHFCGMMGTIYAWPRGQGIDGKEMLSGTNGPITAIVAALAFLACVASCVFFILHSVKLRRERARRRRVVVAAVFLDNQDRILVNSSDGMLPMCDIASLSGGGGGGGGGLHGSRRSILSSGSGPSGGTESTVLGMDLTTGHDAFVSALRMSWGWTQPSSTDGPEIASPSFSDSAIGNGSGSGSRNGQQTLANTLAEIRRGSLVTMESSMTGSRHTRLSVTKFLERFAISSGQLASKLLGQQDGISRLGVLYDQILTTGWVKLSNSNDTVSKGQLIFLVRRVTSPNERNDLLTRHFIFAEAQAVAASLHKTLAVPLDHTVPLLEDITTFCESTLRPTIKPGHLYAGVAVVQATPFDGLRILLEHDNRAQLPMRELCAFNGDTFGDELGGTIEELGEALTWLDGMSMLSIITRNMTSSKDQVGGPRVAALLTALERAVVPMLDEMLNSEDMAHILPRLYLHPVLIPLTPGGTKKTSKLTGYTPPYIVVFYANYDAAVNTFTDKWLPFSLFRAQNSCVMAGRIAAAAKATGASITGVNEDEEVEYGYGYGRRPSKVQFDVMPSGTGNNTPGMAMEEGQAPTFGGFSFPPKDGEVVPVAGLGISKSSALKGQPRRSSLARTKFEDKDMGGIITSREKERGLEVLRTEREVVPGVGGWDPDWLIILLRTSLRADA